MSYLVLARKYRPQTFNDVVGQAPIVKTLKNSLARNRVAHAILFSGVRGVGKTTLARIMAKAINCQSETEERPCNTCRSCKEITGGQSLDLHEIDGASNRGIQEIRELKEKIRFMPTSSRYKIIIIDEVHMLTTEAFNALLKTLEEPPEHVYFMFATTELHKIPITILSRCQRYELKRVSATELFTHFAAIAQQEQVVIDKEALGLIVREAEGSVRDGLSLLDQIFSYANDTISVEDVVQVLGLTDRNILFNIIKALLQGDRTQALQTLDAAFEYGMDFKRFTADLLGCMRTLLLVRIGGLQELIDLPREEITYFQELGKDIGVETIHMKMNQLLTAVEDIRHSSQPRLALETAFLKIIESGNIIPVSELLGKIDALLKTGTDEAVISNPPVDDKKKTPDSGPVAEKKGPPRREERPSIAPSPPSSPENRTPQPEEPPLPDEPFDLAEEDLKPVRTQTPPQQNGAETGKEHEIEKFWHDFIEDVKKEKVWMAKDLARAERVERKGNTLQLHYGDPASCTLLSSKENRRHIQQFLLDFFGIELTVEFVLPQEVTGDDTGNNDDNPNHRRKMLSNDPMVQMAVEVFNGQVGDIRLTSRKQKPQAEETEAAITPNG